MTTTSKNTWDSVHVDGVETIYYVGSPASELSDRVVGFDVEESLDNITTKNVLFFEWALNREWDVLCRINASTYVDKIRLKEYCKDIKPGSVYGRCVFGTRSRHWLPGGLGIIMSRDVVATMIRNKERVSKVEPEDIALSWLAEDCGFKIDEHNIRSSVINKNKNEWLLFNHENSCFEFSNFSVAYSSGTPIFRVNQAIGGRECNRHLDKHCMEQLFECQRNDKSSNTD